MEALESGGTPCNLCGRESGMLSKHEEIRNRRERAFQARVLATLDKPKGAPILAALNSPIVLWLLSAILITSGGAYLNNHQQCIQNALTDIDTYSHLAT